MTTRSHLTRANLAAVYQLVLDLRIDEKNGLPVRVPADLMGRAEAYLEHVLTDAAAGLLPHVAWLEQLGIAFRPPPGRWAGGPEREPAPGHLPVAQAVAVTERGLAALADPNVFPQGRGAALAELLLNPAAVYDLADFIGYTLPDAWLPTDDEAARAEADRAAARAGVAGTPTPHGYAALVLGGADRGRPGAEVVFDGAAGAAAFRHLAAEAYGDPEYVFVLKLLTRPDHRAVFEIAPAPKRGVNLWAASGPTTREKYAIPVPDKEAPPDRAAQSAAGERLPDDVYQSPVAAAYLQEGEVVVRCYRE